MNFDFANALVYLIVSFLFVFAALLIGSLIRPRRPSPDKAGTYECGEETIGSSWIQFNVRFYVVALVFLIFDVEVALLFPWVTIFKEAGLLAFAEIALFVAVLAVAFAYVWAKGDLEWLKGGGEVRSREGPPA